MTKRETVPLLKTPPLEKALLKEAPIKKFKRNRNRVVGPRLTFISQVCLALSSILLAAFFVSHASRPDALMFATIFPVFFWLAVGLVVTAGIIKYRTAQWSLFAAWCAIAFVLGDSPQNLVRGLVSPDSQWTHDHGASLGPAGKTPVRIVSFNCLRKTSALIELKSLRPDVILLQESVSKKEMDRLIETNFAGFVSIWSRDTSLLVRGKVDPFPVAKALAPRYQFAAVTLVNGAKFNVVSLHLQPSPRQFDIWNMETWTLFSKLRKIRRRQMNEIRAEIGAAIDTNPTVIGGDFNAPAGDPMFDAMSPRFRDSWADAGRGWGKTSLNQYPVHRIDQIWITQQFETVNVRAKRSDSSDHRMVICDLWLKQ